MIFDKISIFSIMKVRTKHILEVLKVLAWIIYLGLCIKTGIIIISFIASFYNPEVAASLYLGVDYSPIYNSGLWKYVVITSFLIALPALKAYMFYLVIKLLSGINLEKPFSQRVGNLLVSISRVALEIGILAIISNGYAQWLQKSETQFVYESNSTEFLFMAGIVFVIAQIFKRGLELQTENELTV